MDATEALAVVMAWKIVKRNMLPAGMTQWENCIAVLDIHFASIELDATREHVHVDSEETK